MKSKYIFWTTVIVFLIQLGSYGQNKNWFETARHGNLEEIKKIVAQNPEAVDAIDINKSSMLILACYYNNVSVAKFIADKTTNINYKSEMGSALLAATVKGNIEVAAYLLKLGADINSSDANNTTALIYAVQFKNPALIKVLLTFNPDKSIMDKNGKNAFEYAVQTNNNEIIDLLK